MLSIAQPIFGANWTAAGAFVPAHGLLPVRPWKCASHTKPPFFVHDVCHKDTALAASSSSAAGRPKREVHDAIQVLAREQSGAPCDLLASFEAESLVAWLEAALPAGYGARIAALYADEDEQGQPLLQVVAPSGSLVVAPSGSI